MITSKEVPKQIAISLSREASMSSMAIGIGLTHIRKYDFAHEGFFYSGLHSFSSGLERLLKLVLIYDHRLTHEDAFPDNSQLKCFRHNIDDLIDKARQISQNRGCCQSDRSLETDPLIQRIISFLKDFAVQARYYNLDYLSGRKQSGPEPLTRWDQEVCSEILKRHYRPNPERLALLDNLAVKLDDISHVLFTDESGNDIHSMVKMVAYADLIPTKQKYSMYYLYLIARFLSNLLAELEYQGGYFPFLREYFTIFRLEKRAHILRKKTWNPMPPD